MTANTLLDAATASKNHKTNYISKHPSLTCQGSETGGPSVTVFLLRVAEA